MRNVLVRLQSPPTAANRSPCCTSSAGQGVSQAGSQSLRWLQARGGRGKCREFDSEAGPGEYEKAQAVFLNSGLDWSLIKPIPGVPVASPPLAVMPESHRTASAQVQSRQNNEENGKNESSEGCSLRVASITG